MRLRHLVVPLTLVMVALIRQPAPTGAQDTGVYYVAPDGPADGDGSRARPFPSAKAALDRVGGGKTLIFRPGIYRGPIEVPLSCRGSRERPTVLKSEERWKAVVIGAESHAIASADDCHGVVVDGFEVMGARYDGIKLNGDHSVVRNCYVHSNAHMGIALHDQDDCTVERNLIEFNGTHVQFHHGVYADGERLTVRENIVRHNASFGLHLYPAIRNSRIENNLVHGQTRKPGIIIACAEGGGRNVIVNNTVALNGEGITIWNGDGERVANNILFQNGVPVRLDERTKNVAITHNLIEPPPDSLPAGNVAGDPRFVEASRGVFWLTAESPAIGKGDPGAAPERDFWGRPRPKNRPVDLGCFPFVSVLAAPDARRGWHHGWPYRFAPEGKSELPDLWSLPPEKDPRS